MKILISNDDGIEANGILKLAQLASELGKVTVVAPDRQRSASSHALTFGTPLSVKKISFPVPDITAYSVSGTPADCIKIAVQCLLPDKPDLILSGINCGYNLGADTAYSGTVGAAMEGYYHQIPSMAISTDPSENYFIIDKLLIRLIKDILSGLPENGIPNCMWNINFPDGSSHDCKGMRMCPLTSYSQYQADYIKTEISPGEWNIESAGNWKFHHDFGTDAHAVASGYISVTRMKEVF